MSCSPQVHALIYPAVSSTHHREQLGARKLKGSWRGVFLLNTVSQLSLFHVPATNSALEPHTGLWFLWVGVCAQFSWITCPLHVV